jgi:hypothetical protein
MSTKNRAKIPMRSASPAPSNFSDLAQILELIPPTAIVIPASRLNTFPTLPVLSVQRIKMSRRGAYSQVPHTNCSFAFVLAQSLPIAVKCIRGSSPR